MAASAEGPKGATPITDAQNRAVLDALPFGDTQDFEDARRGFLGSLPEVEIVNEQGRVVWSLRDYAFLAGEEAPPTVNPSLWRQARLLHNVYPIRGAQVRDANAWAKYLNEAMHRFAPHADVVFAQHHWPVWGGARVLDYLGGQRDLYKYLHDQTVRLMNHGYKAAEIAERLTLPKSLAGAWHVRGYYGTLSHNAKAVYQRYLGW
jgi:alkyl sulfatase BDS1-like metallo-beta-lactamase superfamily hydrolase